MVVAVKRADLLAVFGQDEPPPNGVGLAIAHPQKLLCLWAVKQQVYHPCTRRPLDRASANVPETRLFKRRGQPFAAQGPENLSGQ